MTEMFCPLCEKLFIPAPQHIYKDNGKVYCSWTCYYHRNDKKKPRPVKIVEQYTESGNTIRLFRGAIEAADSVNGTADCIRTACRKCTFYKGYLWRYKNDLP